MPDSSDSPIERKTPVIFDEFSDEDDRGVFNGGQGWSREERERIAACPREADHRYGPAGYMAWHDWADKRRKTHNQIKCECGLFLLMEEKKRRVG